MFRSSAARWIAGSVAFGRLSNSVTSASNRFALIRAIPTFYQRQDSRLRERVAMTPDV